MSAKDPKGRKAGGGKAGGKAGAGERAHSCGMTGDALQRGFDGEGGAQDVASHVAGCDPCGSALELLQLQRDAVLFLTASAVVTAPHTAVEQILSSTARAGRAKLADLLYEMAKACLIVLPDLKRRIERKVEPREVPVVASELQSINSRLELTDGSIALRDVPHQTPEEARALKVARSCLAILDNVEGASERQQLAWSQVLIFEGKPGEAERVLRRLLDEGNSLAHRELAQRNAMYAMMQQRKYEDAVALGLTALSERQNDCVVLYNLAVCHASRRNRSEFEVVSHRLARHVADGSAAWLVRLLQYEMSNFAKSLETSPADVAASFELPSEGLQRGE
jgi:hypothetical protein